MAAQQEIAKLCEVSELGEEAMALVQDGVGPGRYLGLLVEKRYFLDAVRFLAHALPKREAVWWAWMCARRAAGAEAAPKVLAALDATEKWIAQPTEAHRQAAKAAAEVAELKTAAGCAGLAAFFSGGSLGPPEVPPVPPGEYLTAKAVSSAVFFAAVSNEPEKAAEKFEAYLQQGIEVANRIKLWEKE